MVPDEAVKLFDLSTENAWIKDAFFEKLSDLYDRGDFTAGYSPGPVEELEELLAAGCERRFAVGVGAGTHALHMTAFALGLGPGDEVIVPANTFLSSATAFAMVGARPVECDVDPETLNISRETVEAVATERTRAVVAVNLYGSPAPYDDLAGLGIPIVEDAAHSHGAVYRGRPSGSFGDYSVFSFFPSKVVGGIGDSGAMLFDDASRDAALRAFRNCGQSKPHLATVLGNVYRMHTVQALFLIEKWRMLNRIVAERRRVAAVYASVFEGTGVRPQRVLPDAASSFFAYVVRVPDRDAVGEKLKQAGVPWTIQYRYLLHDQPIWDEIGGVATHTPNAQAALGELLSLPVHAGVTDSQARHVGEAVLAAGQ